MSKKLVQDHVYHCVVFPLLLIVCKCVGAEDTSCGTVWERNVVTFISVIGFWHSAVLGLLSYFLFVRCQMFLVGEMAGLQAGQFSNRTLVQWTHATVRWFNHCLAEICRTFSEKDKISMGAHVALTSVHNFDGGCPDVQAANSIGSDAHLYQQKIFCMSFL